MFDSFEPYPLPDATSHVPLLIGHDTWRRYLAGCALSGLSMRWTNAEDMAINAVEIADATMKRLKNEDHS